MPLNLSPVQTGWRRGRNDTSGLRLAVERQRGCSLLTVFGEFDTAAMPMLDEAMAGLTPAQGHVLVLDLQAVTFIDTGVVDALMAASDRWSMAGGELLIHKMSQPVWRVMELLEKLGRPVFDELGLVGLEERAV